MEIINFESRYAGAFETLNREWLEKYFRVEPIDQEVLSDPQGQVIDHGGIILFAKLGEEVVGTVALKNQGADGFELTKMAVTAGHQGAGIGQALLSAAVSRFESGGGSRLYLESHSSLVTAIRLYESAGFVHVAPPTPSDYDRADVYMIYRPKAK